MPPRLRYAFVTALLVLAACASEGAPSIERRAHGRASSSQPTPPSTGASDDASPRAATDPASPHARDVVHTATIRLRAARPSQVVDTARRYVEAHEGYMDDASTFGAGPDAATSRATFRVPSATFRAAVDHLRSLGGVLEVSERGEDMTLVRTDLDARIAAKRALEQRLLALSEHTGSVAELIQVENELGRVRGDLEAMEATRRAMHDRIHYATITLSVESPSQPVVARAESFGSRLDRAVTGGLRAAEGFVTSSILLAIAISPAAVLGFLGFLALRATRRRTNATAR